MNLQEIKTSCLKDLISLINRVKNDDVSEISNRGYELSKRHTYDKRVKFLLENFSNE